MGNDKRIVELVYAFFAIMFSEVLFSAMIDNGMHSVMYFGANRTDCDFHISVISVEDKLILHDKSKCVGELNIKDLPQKTPITQTLHRLSDNGKIFNIHIDHKANILSVYFQYTFPNYMFKLGKIPDKGSQVVEIIKSLDDFYLPNPPEDMEMIMTLVYLGTAGCLSDKLIVLYRGLLVVINNNGRRFFFGLDPTLIPDRMLQTSATGGDRGFLNKFLIAFKITSNSIIFYTPAAGIQAYGTRHNPIGDRFSGFFSSDRETDIKIAAGNDDYGRLAHMVNDSERKEGKARMIELLQGLSGLNFFETFFPSTSN